MPRGRWSASQRFDFLESWRNERKLRQRGNDGVDGLEAVSGDAEDDLVIGTEPATARQLERGGDGDTTRGLGENASELSEETNAFNDRTVVDRGAPAASLGDDARGLNAVGGISD